MSEREEKLKAFLAQERGPQAFVWGSHDCLLRLANWGLLNGYDDAGAKWRGQYADAVGCLRLVRSAGGMVAMARRGARSVGALELAADAEYRPGDVAVGDFAQTIWDREVGLIRAGAYWTAIDSTVGLIVGPARISAAWRV